MSDTPNSLVAALAAFQAELPVIERSETAGGEGGRRWRYADLATVSAKVLPLLAKHGLCWTTMPMLDDGKFLLRYELAHVSGEKITGDYPLPPPTSSAHALGSAITYGRRYTLSAVTGIAPDEDDDDGQAASVRPEAARTSRPNTTARRPESTTDPDHAVTRARAELEAKVREYRLNAQDVITLYTAETGVDPRRDTDVARLRSFTQRLQRPEEVQA